MNSLPQVNAAVLQINRESGVGAFSEDYDRPAVSPTVVWNGNLDAYIERNIVSTFNSNGELRRVLEVTLFLAGDLPITIEPGDVLTYQAGNPDSPVTLAGRVQNITDPAFLATLPDYYKCALEEVNVP